MACVVSKMERTNGRERGTGDRAGARREKGTGDRAGARRRTGRPL